MDPPRCRHDTGQEGLGDNRMAAVVDILEPQVTPLSQSIHSGFCFAPSRRDACLVADGLAGGFGAVAAFVDDAAAASTYPSLTFK